MLFAKSGLELLILTVFHHENQFIYPLTWILVLALVFSAVLQVSPKDSIVGLELTLTPFSFLFLVYDDFLALLPQQGCSTLRYHHSCSPELLLL